MARGKANRTGRSEKMGAFVPMKLEVMDCPAFATLPPLAQCIYWQLQRRVGYKGDRNGEVFYSVREAAERFSASKNTAAAAFHLLQARGFIRPTRIGTLGVEGEGRATTWHLTDWPARNGHPATRDFLTWTPGHDFPVEKGRAPPKMQKPVPPAGTSCPPHWDEAPRRRVLRGRPCPPHWDEGAVLEGGPVPLGGTPKELPGGRGR